MDNTIHPVKEVTEGELIERSQAPRVTYEALLQNIKSETYFTAAEGLKGAGLTPDRPHHQSLHLLTFCVLTLRNGFTVTGQSACASVDNYDAIIGQRIAREDAIRQVWPLMGYELKSKVKLVEAGTDPSLPSMKTYVGMKVVHAEAMTREAYNVLRGWQLPADEDGSDEGYIVEYADGIGVPNHKGFNGYISWSPKDVFEGSYKEL